MRPNPTIALMVMLYACGPDTEPRETPPDAGPADAGPSCEMPEPTCSTLWRNDSGAPPCRLRQCDEAPVLLQYACAGEDGATEVLTVRIFCRDCLCGEVLFSVGTVGVTRPWNSAAPPCDAWRDIGDSTDVEWPYRFCEYL